MASARSPQRPSAGIVASRRWDAGGRPCQLAGAYDAARRLLRRNVVRHGTGDPSAAQPRQRRAHEPMPRLAARELGAVLLGLWRSPRFALPALLSLALSVGGATAVFSVFSGLMLRPLPFADEERLVQLGVHADGSGEAPVISAPFT